jgi:hypothetical protein
VPRSRRERVALSWFVRRGLVFDKQDWGGSRMSGDRVSVPPMIRQGELVEEIARSVVAHAAQPWTTLTVNIRALAPYMEGGSTSPGRTVRLKETSVPAAFQS